MISIRWRWWSLFLILFSTILHRFELGLMWTGLISIPIIQFIEVLRMLFGPLPKSLCWFQSLWRNCPTVASLIFLDLIVIFRVRFLFIFTMKTAVYIFHLCFSVFVHFQIQRLRASQWRFSSFSLLLECWSLEHLIWHYFYGNAGKTRH